MDYVTLSKLKARVASNLDDGSLTDIIREQSAAITLALGKEPGSPMVDDFHTPDPTLFLTFKPDGSTIVIRDMTQPGYPSIDPETYVLDGRIITRTRGYESWLTTFEADPRSGKWPSHTRVTYAMADSPGVLAVCQGVCIDLCRLAINDMGVEQSESIGGYSHSSKDIHAERKRILGRLTSIRGIRPVMCK
jgi:hypothetical protein